MNFEQYGNMEMDARLILMVVMHKLSPHSPVELTQDDYDAVARAHPNGPALSTTSHELVGRSTLTIEIVDAEDAIRTATRHHLPRTDC